MNQYLSQMTFRPRSRDDYKLANQLASLPYFQHQQLWTFFARPPGSTQPFLFRQAESDQAPRFLVLSEDRPSSADARWQVQTKLFQPALQEGQQLAFSARLNPTRSVRQEGVRRGKRQDLVMAALYGVEEQHRAVERQRLIHEELPKWLAKRGERAGFEIVQQDDRLLCAVMRYEALRFRTTAESKSQNITLGCADFVGQLRVTDPQRFTQTLTSGLGHARSFGLGMLLVKRPT